MPNTYKIDKMSIDMRIDRWIKNEIGKIPQSLIEKLLRKGNIKLNNKKIKSSTKLKFNDVVKVYNFNYNIDKSLKKKKFVPSNKIIKENGDYFRERPQIEKLKNLNGSFGIRYRF